MSQEVETYLNKLKRWQTEIIELREIILDCGLTEDFKWMHPCYTHNSKNIVLIHEFKDYCAILFHKGSLLKDTNHILIQQTENTQSARQIRFTDLSVIETLKPILRKYIKEAIAIEQSGLKIELKKTVEFDIPEELNKIFKENSEFEKAFKKLTSGRQRGYILYFSKSKQAKTRIAQIEKNTARILSGKGLNDCICGLSKRKTNCDGSHRILEK